MTFQKQYKNKLYADIDECLSNPCSMNADCQNTDGSFTCTCKDGYFGTGIICDGNLNFYTFLSRRFFSFSFRKVSKASILESQCDMYIC